MLLGWYATKGEFDASLRFQFDSTPHESNLTFSRDLSANLDLRNLERPDPVGSTIQNVPDLVKETFHVLLEDGDADVVYDVADQFATHSPFRSPFLGRVPYRTDHQDGIRVIGFHQFLLAIVML